MEQETPAGKWGCDMVKREQPAKEVYETAITWASELNPVRKVWRKGESHAQNYPTLGSREHGHF